MNQQVEEYHLPCPSAFQTNKWVFKKISKIMFKIHVRTVSFIVCFMYMMSLDLQ